MKKSLYAVVLGLPVLFSACHNGDQVFPDFDYQTISFATQTPVQTITLGEDGEFDVTMDNEHRFQILAVLGGINTNKSNRWADYVIDNSLVDGIAFADGGDVKALPSTHYNVTSDPDRLYINKGSILGGLDIQLTDAFFADPASATVCYVIPVRLVTASDSILEGSAKDGIAAPNVLNETDWNVLPKNYTLYGIKYKNKYTGTWLSRGTVTTTINGEKTEATHSDPNGYWENEEIHYLTTKSLNTCAYVFEHALPVTLSDGTSGETVVSCEVLLNIADNGSITCTSGTEGCAVSGKGTYTYHGAGNAWGALERDKIELDLSYEIPYVINEKTGATDVLKVQVVETLVARDRQNKFETFSYVLK